MYIFSTAKEKSSIIVEKKDNVDQVEKDGDPKDASFGADQSSLFCASPIQVKTIKKLWLLDQ